MQNNVELDSVARSKLSILSAVMSNIVTFIVIEWPDWVINWLILRGETVQRRVVVHVSDKRFRLVEVKVRIR